MNKCKILIFQWNYILIVTNTFKNLFYVESDASDTDLMLWISTRIMDSRITNNTILKSCAKEGLVVTTLWLMRGKFVGWTSSIMNSYRTKTEGSIKEKKKLEKHRQEKQGSNKYQKILEETFKYPLSSSKAERCSEVKISVSKFTESVVGELSTMLVDAEVQIGLENERKEALESEVNVLKRKQEALELTCQETNVKLKTQKQWTLSNSRLPSSKLLKKIGK